MAPESRAKAQKAMRTTKPRVGDGHWRKWTAALAETAPIIAVAVPELQVGAVPETVASLRVAPDRLGIDPG